MRNLAQPRVRYATLGFVRKRLRREVWRLFDFGRWLVVEVFPLHGLAEGLDAEHDFTALKEADGAAGLADDDGQGGSRLADGRAGPVAGTEALGKRQIGIGGIDKLGGLFDDAFGVNDESAV